MTKGIAILSGSSVVVRMLEDGNLSFGHEKPIELNISGNVYATGSVYVQHMSAAHIISDVITSSIVYSEHFTGSHAHLDYVDFNGFPGEAPWQTGRLYYNTASNLLSLYTEYPNTHIHLGEQVVAKIQNNLATTLSKGKVVYITGSTSSDVPRVVTASWDTERQSSRTFGVVMSDISAGERGYALLNGLLEGIDTSGYNPGDLIYLSSSGDYTKETPQTPRHEVRIGEVIRKNNNNGSIFVRIQNGYEIEELHDVNIVNPNNGDILVYKTSPFQHWTNSTILSGSYEIVNSLTASNIFYSASNPEYWSPSPNTIREAIDRLAAVIFNTTSGTIP